MVDKYKLIDGILFVLAQISILCMLLGLPIGLAIGLMLEESGNMSSSFGRYFFGWIVVHFILCCVWFALGDLFRDQGNEKRKMELNIKLKLKKKNHERSLKKEKIEDRFSILDI